MEIPVRAAILGAAFAVGAGISNLCADCPLKMSPKLCPAFEAARDSAYLDLRIVLDANVESGFVWDKSQPVKERPLRTASESLIVRYDLRQIGAPESAYVRPYAPTDPNPLNTSVLHHDAAVTKANVGKLAAETYVAAVEPGCKHLSDAVCTDVNTRPDTAFVFVSIYFVPALEKDSSARAAYLAEYAVRDSIVNTGMCSGHGYLATPVATRAMGMDRQVLAVEPAHLACILPIRPGPAARASGPKRASDAYRNRRLDGRLERAALRPYSATCSRRM
jgi:hypothetical protein